MAAIASFSVSPENGQCVMDSLTPKTYIYQVTRKKKLASILITDGKLKILSGHLYTHG